MMFKPSWLISSILLLAHFTWAQSTIRGKVLNAESQQPLPLANVFLSGTTKATVTDQNGSFTLVNVPTTGTFDLVVTYVGFTPLKVRIGSQDQLVYHLMLKPGELPLAAITVKARRWKGTGWASRVALFRDNFIGTSRNARQCRLLNPHILTFEQTRQRLSATAQEPLLIENRALGYRIKMQLDFFTYDYSSSVSSYQGSSSFEPLRPKNALEARRWQENRQRAYRGSLMHFGRAFYRRQLVEEGFTMQHLVEHKDSLKAPIPDGEGSDEVVTARALGNAKQLIPLPMAAYQRFLDSAHSTTVQPAISFSDVLQVTYTKESEPVEYQRLLKPTYELVFQTSRLRMQVPRVTLEANGQFWPVNGLRSEGYWSWELVADDLPFDYNPQERINFQN